MASLKETSVPNGLLPFFFCHIEYLDVADPVIPMEPISFPPLNRKFINLSCSL